MKTRKCFIAALLMMVAVVAVVLGSCKKEEPEYSCNPVINDWAVQNAELFETATRKQIATLPSPLLHAAYNTLTPQRKYDLWQEKFSIEGSIWGDSLQEKIMLLANAFSVSWYDESEKCDCDYDFLEQWENDILTNYLDTIDYVIAFYMLSTIDEIYELNDQPESVDLSWANIPENILTKNESKGTREAEYPPDQNNCNCRTNLACFGNPMGGRCVKGNCNKRRRCGLGGVFECTGECGDDALSL